ncbi:MAG TPA: hypothetical protein VLH16_02800 [Bacteroidales bacterium]|nr:hypothetical protein [Bacteroidales bacterium]
MAEKEIALIRRQIVKLSEKSFDLGVWKKTTVLLLENVLGANDRAISAVNAINTDYSSWTLRDTSGVSALDKCKKLGQEILESVIARLELYGIPEKTNSEGIDPIQIRQALESELRVSQYRMLISIKNEKISDEEKIKRLVDFFSEVNQESNRLILARILLDVNLME